MAEEEKTEQENKKETQIFIFRIILWSVFALIIPVVFIGWRYDIFKKASSLQLSGWGLIIIVIVFVFFYAVIKYICAAFVEWSMVKQIVKGVIKIVLPLGGLLAICIALRDSLDTFIQALSIVLISEVIAIPINPFPEWIWKKTQGRFENTVDFLADTLYNKNKNKKRE